MLGFLFLFVFFCLLDCFLFYFEIESWSSVGRYLSWIGHILWSCSSLVSHLKWSKELQLSPSVPSVSHPVWAWIAGVCTIFLLLRFTLTMGRKRYSCMLFSTHTTEIRESPGADPAVTLLFVSGTILWPLSLRLRTRDLIVKWEQLWNEVGFFFFFFF